MAVFPGCRSEPGDISVVHPVFLNDANISPGFLPEKCDLDLGVLQERRFLHSGWSNDEKESESVSFVWMLEGRGLVTFPFQPAGETDFRIKCRPFAFEKMDQPYGFIPNKPASNQFDGNNRWMERSILQDSSSIPGLWNQYS